MAELKRESHSYLISTETSHRLNMNEGKGKRGHNDPRKARGLSIASPSVAENTVGEEHTWT